MKSHSNVHALSDHEIATFARQLDHIATLVGEGFQPLEPKTIRSLLKLTVKRRAVAPLIARLASEYGIASPSAPLALVNEQLAAAEKLRPLVSKVAALHKVLSDLLLTIEAHGWESLSVNYGMLSAEAKKNPVLAGALLPVRDALRNAKKRAKSNGDAAPAAEPKPASPAAPAAHTSPTQ